MLFKRALESRSYLKFDYPGPNNTIETTFYLPFFENIEVSEGQKANYAVYDLLSRAGNLYAYMGAKSRSLVIKFSITLPHVKHYISTEGLETLFGQGRKSNRKQELRDQFLKQVKGSLDQAKNHRDKFEQLTGRTILTNQFAAASEELTKASALTLLGGPGPLIQAGADQLSLLAAAASKEQGYLKKDNQAVNLFMFWINMVRTSVINHSSNVTQGPPIITLNHGIMYNQIPTVCTNFSINIDKNAGYHLETMTPRKIDVVLNLEEVRTGDWGKYNRGDKVQGNNLPGWDSFVKFETMDPYGNVL